MTLRGGVCPASRTFDICSAVVVLNVELNGIPICVGHAWVLCIGRTEIEGTSANLLISVNGGYLDFCRTRALEPRYAYGCSSAPCTGGGFGNGPSSIKTTRQRGAVPSSCKSRRGNCHYHGKGEDEGKNLLHMFSPFKYRSCFFVEYKIQFSHTLANWHRLFSDVSRPLMKCRGILHIRNHKHPSLVTGSQTAFELDSAISAI